MSDSFNIALTTYKADVPLDELTATAAALSIQANRDVQSIWGVSASVSAFADDSQADARGSVVQPGDNADGHPAPVIADGFPQQPPAVAARRTNRRGRHVLHTTRRGTLRACPNRPPRHRRRSGGDRSKPPRLRRLPRRPRSKSTCACTDAHGAAARHIRAGPTPPAHAPAPRLGSLVVDRVESRAGSASDPLAFRPGADSSRLGARGEALNCFPCCPPPGTLAASSIASGAIRVASRPT